MELTEKSATPSAIPISAVLSIFHSPASTFALLAARPATWMPILLLMAAHVGPLLWYYLAFVDYGWFQEYSLSSVTDPVEREQFASMALSRQAMASMNAITVAVAVLASCALGALYFTIVGKVKNQEFSFSKGFSLSAWASMPFVLLLPLGAM